MARPKNKEELINFSEQNFLSLLSFVNNLSEKERNRNFPKQYLNQNIRDVLAHLHHWHLLFMGWHEIGRKGNIPDMPASGYTWKETKELNQVIQKRYSSFPLQDIIELLQESHEEIQKIIGKYDNEALFEKKKYKWTGSTSLAVYLRATTSSHYDWALKLIKKCLKQSSKDK